MPGGVAFHAISVLYVLGPSVVEGCKSQCQAPLVLLKLEPMNVVDSITDRLVADGERCQYEVGDIGIRSQCAFRYSDSTIVKTDDPDTVGQFHWRRIREPQFLIKELGAKVTAFSCRGIKEHQPAAAHGEDLMPHGSHGLDDVTA